MFFIDASPVTKSRITSDGYLVAQVRAAKTGVQRYSGAEVGRPELATVDVYRSPDEVFSKASMSGLANLPITNQHPSTAVDAATWRASAVGMTGGTVARDGEHLVVPIAVMDGTAVDAINGGRKQLSPGYMAEIKFGDGIAPDGTPYQATQSNIKFNHLALVDRGRSGPTVGITDKGDPILSKKIVFDGIDIEVTDQAAQAIDKLQNTIAANKLVLADANDKHTAAIAVKDTEIGKLTAEIVELKAAVLTDEQISEYVKQRAEVIARAEVLGLKDAKGTSVEIRRAAVALKLGDAVVKDKSDDFVQGIFDHASVSGSPLVKPGTKAPLTTDAAYDAMCGSISSAWEHKS